ncbi:MAG: hypothetical protein L0229_02600 [Blastocatellia bacterium]|nr:hypothetical protein [Blastocatellia bacterium]
MAAILSTGAFLYFYSQDATNLYGDGIAHVNIARKVVDHPDDSLWQRYMQIGSPWLPLQTVLMLPLVANDRMWRTGIAGSLLSMLSFVITAVVIYLHARHLYRKEEDSIKNILPLISAAVFIFNPSALYMQATPMSEMVFMAALASAVYLLQRWVTAQSRGQEKESLCPAAVPGRLALAALVMSLATLARYEAWPVALLASGVVALTARGGLGSRLKNATYFSLLAATGPAYWLWHNWAIYGDALWFLTGPYSARAIYLQNRANLGWSKIFVGNAALDLLLMAVTVAVSVGPLVMMLAAAGFGRLIAVRRRALIEDAPALLLLVPFFFHVVSLYRGEIQIFPLAAFGLLNVRYGLPHLLAAALFAAGAVPLFRRLGGRRAIALVCLSVGMQYWYLLSDGASQLAVYQEGYRYGVNARPARERAKVSRWLKEHRHGQYVLMQTSALGPVVPQGGLLFSEVIHEGTTRWHRLGDRVPADVSTIILEEGDALDSRFGENPALALDMAANFQERFSAGKIKVFERKTMSSGQ